MSMVINTLEFAKQLEDVGFTRAQAETQANLLVKVIDQNIATKLDLKSLEVKLTQDILGVEREIKELDVKINQQMKELEYRLTVRCGSMLAVSIAILGALITVLAFLK